MNEKMDKENAYKKAKWIVSSYLHKLYDMTGDAHYLANVSDVSKENIVEHLTYYTDMLIELKGILENGEDND